VTRRTYWYRRLAEACVWLSKKILNIEAFRCGGGQGFSGPGVKTLSCASGLDPRLSFSNVRYQAADWYPLEELVAAVNRMLSERDVMLAERERSLIAVERQQTSQLQPISLCRLPVSHIQKPGRN